VRAHRAWLRTLGLRPVQIRPDVTAASFAAQAYRQTRAVAAGELPSAPAAGL